MKWYRVKKAFAAHKEGDEVQLEESKGQALAEAGLVEMLGTGGGPEQALVEKAVEALTAGLAAAVEKAAATAARAAEDLVAARLKGRLDAARSTGSARFERIEPAEAEEDRTRSLADFFACVGTAGCSSDPNCRAAQERLVKVYGSRYSDDFQERYERAEKTAGRTGAKAPMMEASGSTGGYTVPVQFEQRLLEIAAEEEIVRPMATVIPMSTREVQIPMLNQTSAPSAGDTAYFGGLVARWVQESATRTETEPTFKQVKLVANELSGYSVASRELLADNAVALESVLTRLMGGAIGWFTDYAFLRGDGVAKPLGILNAGSKVTVTRNTANDFKVQDISKMWAKLLPRSQTRAIWVIAQTVMEKLLQLADASNRLAFLPYYPGSDGGPFTVKPAAQLLGRPIFNTEKTPALGTAGDVMLIDPAYYLCGERAGIEVSASEHVNFLKNQMTWRFLVRREGQPWMDAPFTMSDASSTLSPFVVLS